MINALCGPIRSESSSFKTDIEIAKEIADKYRIANRNVAVKMLLEMARYKNIQKNNMLLQFYNQSLEIDRHIDNIETIVRKLLK